MSLFRRWAARDRAEIDRLTDALTTAQHFLDDHHKYDDEMCGVCIAEWVVKDAVAGRWHWPHDTYRQSPAVNHPAATLKGHSVKQSGGTIPLTYVRTPEILRGNRGANPTTRQGDSREQPPCVTRTRRSGSPSGASCAP